MVLHKVLHRMLCMVLHKVLLPAATNARSGPASENIKNCPDFWFVFVKRYGILQSPYRFFKKKRIKLRADRLIYKYNTNHESNSDNT